MPNTLRSGQGSATSVVLPSGDSTSRHETAWSCLSSGLQLLLRPAPCGTSTAALCLLTAKQA
eukprot:6491320-Amphidinium_carterae.2